MFSKSKVRRSLLLGYRSDRGFGFRTSISLEFSDEVIILIYRIKTIVEDFVEKQQVIEQALENIFKGIGLLRHEFKNRSFTIDGRLVGDIGEVIAEGNYGISLYKDQVPVHDGEKGGKLIQIKATFKDHLTFGKVPDYYLGFKLKKDGSWIEIFNGPGQIIFDRFRHRKGIGEQLLSFSIETLSELSKGIHESDRISKL
jgi:hypothetical protein